MVAKKQHTPEARLLKAFAYVNKRRGAYGSMREAAKIACLPYPTFYKRFQKGNAGPTFYGPAPVLGRDVEAQLADHVVKCAQVGMCLTQAIICERAVKLAAELKIKSDIVYGRKWFAGLLKRHPELVHRQPQLCESFRFTAVSTPNMEHFFEVLGAAIKDVLPKNIWNVDETCVSLRNTRKTVIAKRGMRNVNVIYEGENKHLTMVACCSAAGASITPMLIFTGQRPKPKLMAGYPEAVQKMSESGFINNDLWYDWVQLFVKETGGNCVLIADWHSTRADLRALQFLRDNNVKLVVLQPHTTHVCQPLDVSGFLSFKSNVREDVAVRRANGIRTDLENLAGIIKKAWNRTMQMQRGADGKESNPVMHGFEKTGIFPFNPAKISPDMKKVADGLLERARLERLQDEAKDAKEDGLPVSTVTGKRKRDDGDGDSDSDGEDEELQGKERAAAIARVLVEPEPIKLKKRLKQAVEGKTRRAELLTGDEAIARLLDKEEAKEVEEAAKAERKRVREAKAAAKAAAPKPAPKKAKKKAKALLSHLLSPPGSSSSSSSAAAAASSPAALVTPSLPAGGGSAAPAAVAFGGGTAFATAMAGAGTVV